MNRAFPEDCEYIHGSARFTNDEKNVIEILAINQNTGEVFACNYPADDNPQYNWILENCEDLDTIHANTWRWIRDQRHDYEQTVMQIAKDEGLIFTSGLADVRSYTSFLKSIFKPFDDSKESELNNLFSIKLELFEMAYIRENQNAELKKALRRAETPLDVVRAAIDIHLDNVANGIQIQEDDD